MPYSIQTADNITIDGIPDHVAPDAPELKARVQQARMQRHMQSPEVQARADAQRASDAAEYDPLKDMNWGERAAANVGAGMTNFGQGLQQVAGKYLGIGGGVSDDDIREKRQRDAQLAASTRGGGVLQVVGEAAPMMLLPAAGAGAGTAAMLAGGAAGGALGGALQPVTEDESRAKNALIGGAAGAVVPGAAKVVGMGARAAWRALPLQSNIEARAADTVRKALPTTEPELLDALREGAQRTPVRGVEREIPTSAAQLTGNQPLAQLEAASRARPGTQGSWAGFDADRNAALYDTVQAMAPSEQKLAEMTAARTARATPMYEDALAEAARTGGFATPVLKHIDDTLASAASANPAARSVLNYARREIAEAPNDPLRMQVVLRTIRDKLSGPVAIGDELGAAVKGSNAVTAKLGNVIDDALDTAAKGKWIPAQRAFREMSQPIKSGGALRAAADELADKPLLGNVPQITATNYQRAIDKASASSKYGDKLTPDARSESDAFLRDVLKPAEAVSRTRKIAMTAGGGSNTTGDLLLTGADMVQPGVGTAVRAVKGLGAMSNDRVQQEAARLLQNPKALADALARVPPADRTQFMRGLLATGNALGITTSKSMPYLGQVAGAALTP